MLNKISYQSLLYSSGQTINWAQFHVSAYRIKQTTGAYGSREFRALYVKRISRVSGEFWLVRVGTPG